MSKLRLFLSSIDSTDDDGRLGRLINHSKLHANCRPRVVVDDNAEPRVALFAVTDIAVGDELLFDYGDRSKRATTDFPWLLQ
jgi:[histone H4]-lysine20 N-methyltransferase SETD8